MGMMATYRPENSGRKGERAPILASSQERRRRVDGSLLSNVYRYLAGRHAKCHAVNREQVVGFSSD